MSALSGLNLIGKSPSFTSALGRIDKFATCDATVLIHGETGTGKELAARAIHYLSSRRELPFIPVNCGALSETLIESELFGHVRGAFTDARETRSGLIAQAKGGTLFLDEMEAMSLRAQVALLRFLQDKAYRPVGGTLVKDANVRVVAATNADLKALAQRGAFRSDLLFRLNVLTVHMPALRERHGDIPVLIEAFLARLNDRSRQPAKVLDPQSMQVLEAYSWPGNVRELENLVQREFLLASGHVIQIDSVDTDQPCAPLQPQQDGLMEDFKLAKARAIAQFEKAYLVGLLTRTGGNLSQAARVSGKDRSDISKLVKKHGFDRLRFSGDFEQD